MLPFFTRSIVYSGVDLRVTMYRSDQRVFSITVGDKEIMSMLTDEQIQEIGRMARSEE